MEINDTFDTDMDLLASGSVAHTWEGSFILAGFGGMWTNSYEAEHHLSFHPSETEPVCWSPMGLASGWSTAFFGSPVITIDPLCVGKGDDHCEWHIQSGTVWEDKARPYLIAYQPFFDRT